MRLTLNEAIELFEECEAFEDSGFSPQDSKLRKKADYTYAGSCCTEDLLYIVRRVCRKLAQQFMEERK